MLKIVLICLGVCLSQAVFAGADGIVDRLESFFDSFPIWLTTVTTVVTVATGITALTPTKSDDVVLGAVLKVLNILAGNVGNNRKKES